MRENTAKLTPAPSVVVALAIGGGIAALLIAGGRRDYPDLHHVLDTGICLLSGIMAVLFWDLGSRMANPLPRHLAVAFSVAFVLNLLHVLVFVEWGGGTGAMAVLRDSLRPASWPPAVLILAIGVLGSVRLRHRGGATTWALAGGLVVISVALLGFFDWQTRYAPAVASDGLRAELLVAPLLWAGTAWWCWRLRHQDRLLFKLSLMSMVLMLAAASQLFSGGPHDTSAMVAHLGRVCGYLVLFLSVMRFAAMDVRARIRAEHELALLNRELERRVAERTTELEAANQRLEREVGERRQAEVRVRAQVERLHLLQQITVAIGERQDLASIFQVAVRSLEESLPVDFSCICLCDGAAGTIKVAHVGVKSGPIARELSMGEAAVIEVDTNGLSRCVQGELVYEPDIEPLAFPFPRRLARGGLRSLIISPLQVESKVFGVLVAARREPNGFVSGECEFVKQLSEHVALAAHQAELYGVLQEAYEDLRQTQQSVMQQERLRALGQMASGIAHDINNGIMPVSMCTEMMLEQEANLSADGRRYLEMIQVAIHDVAQTVSRMSELYRRREYQLDLASVDLNAVIRQVLELTRARWRDMPQERGGVIEVLTELDAELPPVMGVESELREALTNLVLNAADAMAGGGNLTLRTRVTGTATGSPGTRVVVVEVEDSGIGMDEATRRRCLEPFFTTKGERGTGLGLAMVYGIVKRHGAEIEIDSTAGIGTTVRLTFAVPIPMKRLASDAAAAPPVYSRLRILVVDDDPVLTNLLRDVLEGDGHFVIAANGGQAGIDAFNGALRVKEPFAVVITDLGMPFVDGRKVAAAIKAASASTPVILLTGWGQRLVSQGDVPLHVDRVLSKPPKLQELRGAVAEVMRTAGGGADGPG